MPGERPQSGAIATPRFSAFSDEREFLADYRVIASEIGEVATGFDCGLRESEIQAVRDRGERAVMSAHQLGSVLLIAGIQRDCPNFLFAGDLVYPSRDFASTFQISIGQGDRIH